MVFQDWLKRIDYTPCKKKSIVTRTAMFLLVACWVSVLLVNRVAASFAESQARGHPIMKQKHRLPDLLLDRLPIIPYWVPETITGAMVLNVLSSSHALTFLQTSLPVFCMRAAIICCTYYPTPMLLRPHFGQSAYDLMFSGHTTMLFSAAYSVPTYAVASLGALSIVAARQHYTADVVVAGCITELVKALITS